MEQTKPVKVLKINDGPFKGTLYVRMRDNLEQYLEITSQPDKDSYGDLTIGDVPHLLSALGCVRPDKSVYVGHVIIKDLKKLRVMRHSLVPLANMTLSKVIRDSASDDNFIRKSSLSGLKQAIKKKKEDLKRAQKLEKQLNDLIRMEADLREGGSLSRFRKTYDKYIRRRVW